MDDLTLKSRLQSLTGLDVGQKKQATPRPRARRSARC